MGYANTEKWGRCYETFAGHGTYCTLTTVNSDTSMGYGFTPTWADVDNSVIIGAYLDCIICSQTNNSGGGNYITNSTYPAAYPKITAKPTGHAQFDAISNIYGMCGSRANVTNAPVGRIYGDTNFSSIFSSGSSHYWNHEVEFIFYQCAANTNNLYIEDCFFIWRFYVR